MKFFQNDPLEENKSTICVMHQNKSLFIQIKWKTGTEQEIFVLKRGMLPQNDWTHNWKKKVFILIMTDSITNLLDCHKKVGSLNMKERTSFVRTIIGTISLFLNYSEKK